MQQRSASPLEPAQRSAQASEAVRARQSAQAQASSRALPEFCSLRGKPTIIPPEDVLTFRLENPLTISTVRSNVAFRPVTAQDYAQSKPDASAAPGAAISTAAVRILCVPLWPVSVSGVLRLLRPVGLVRI